MFYLLTIIVMTICYSSRFPAAASWHRRSCHYYYSYIYYYCADFLTIPTRLYILSPPLCPLEQWLKIFIAWEPQKGPVVS